jgi:hypothetical protein
VAGHGLAGTRPAGGGTVVIRVVGDAEYPKDGMTLAELAEFVDRARAVGCDERHVVAATVGWHGKVKQVRLIEPSGGR